MATSTGTVAPRATWLKLLRWPTITIRPAPESSAGCTATTPCYHRRISLNSSKPQVRANSSLCRTNLRKIHPPSVPPSRRRYASTTQPGPSSPKPPASTEEPKKTQLYDLHASLGAKFVPFGGFDMPLHYADLSHVESHHWTRSKASIFDVSHMVQHKLSGPAAEAFLMKITPSSIDSLPDHTSTLSCLLDSSGGIVDDTVITRLGPESFYFVTNAACRDSDLAYLQSELDSFAKENPNATLPEWKLWDTHALVAFQGPKAASTLQALVFRDEEDDSVDCDLSTLLFGQARNLQLTVSDVETTPSLLVSRTGYTGEDGFEISIPPESGDATALAIKITKALLADRDTVRMAGLAARDSLRLEAGMCLYGHDISLSTTPPVAALGWVVGKDRRTDDAKFNGASTILKQLASPKTMPQRRVGLTITDKGAPAREGAEIVNLESGETLGIVTSGLPSPTLKGGNIAMALIKNGYHKKGTVVGVKVRKNMRKAEVIKLPFVENKFYRGPPSS